MKNRVLQHFILGLALALPLTQTSSLTKNSLIANAQGSNIGESIPNYILTTQGKPAIAVFEARRESFALGCPAIRDVWSAVSTRGATSAEFSSLLSVNPVVADLHCDGRIKGFQLSDEGPGLLLIDHRDGTSVRHYIDSPLFLSALRSGNLIARNGPEFRAAHPQRGNDLKASLASPEETTSSASVEKRFPLRGSQRDELGDHRRMETTLTISNNGRIDGSTTTWTRDHFEGFTGSVRVTIADDDGNFLYQTENRRFGVSCLFCGGGDEREDHWHEVMPAELLDKVSGYVIEHSLSPRTTKLTREDILILLETFAEAQEAQEGQEAAP